MSTSVQKLLEELCAKVSAYEHAYGQAREEAFADYGNTFSRVMAQLSAKVLSDKPSFDVDRGVAIANAFNDGFAAGKQEHKKALMKAAKALLKAAK
jgi:hypothetical protein